MGVPIYRAPAQEGAHIGNVISHRTPHTAHCVQHIVITSDHHVLLPEAHLAVGVSLESTVLPALGAAITMHRGGALPTRAAKGAPKGRGVQVKDIQGVKTSQEATKRSFAIRPHVDLLVGDLMRTGESAPSPCIGIPMQPMLAKPATTAAEVLQKMGGKAFSAEFKYDGQRAQIHVGEDGEVTCPMPNITPELACSGEYHWVSNSQLDTQVRIFSRKLDEMSSKYPDVVATVARCCRGAEGRGCVLEGWPDHATAPDTTLMSMLLPQTRS